MSKLKNVLAVAGVTIDMALSVSACTASGQAPQSSNGSLRVVHLAETLVVNSGDVIRDTHYIWEGPATSPMLSMTGAQFATLDHLVFEVPNGQHATAAVQLSNAPSGGPLGNHLSNLKIGSFDVPANLHYGLIWTDSLNGDSNTITNVAIFGAARAGISLSNVQATANTFRGVYVPTSSGRRLACTARPGARLSARTAGSLARPMSM